MRTARGYKRTPQYWGEWGSWLFHSSFFLLLVAGMVGLAAGLYAIHRLRSMGLTVRAYEAGSGVGGTWFWNRYPGARCDVPSLEYSFGFSEELQQEWEWSEVFPGQAELERYFNHVADRFDLRRDIRLNTRVTAAAFDDDARTSVAKSRMRHSAVPDSATTAGTKPPTSVMPMTAARPRPRPMNLVV